MSDPTPNIEPPADVRALALAVDTLPEEPPIDVVLDHLDRIDCIKRFIREYEPKLKQMVVAHIQRTGGPVFAGLMMWAETEKKDTTCIDTKAALTRIFGSALAHLGGDMDAALARTVDCVAAQGIKPGTAKRTLDEFGDAGAYDELFKTTVKRDAKGEVVKELSAINTTFLK